MRVAVAPEIVTNRRNYDGKMVDVWSAGVMLYVMLFCTYPFERTEDERETPTKKYQTVRRRLLIRLCTAVGLAMSSHLPSWRSA